MKIKLRDKHMQIFIAIKYLWPPTIIIILCPEPHWKYFNIFLWYGVAASDRFSVNIVTTLVILHQNIIWVESQYLLKLLDSFIKTKQCIAMVAHLNLSLTTDCCVLFTDPESDLHLFLPEYEAKLQQLIWLRCY